MFQTELAKSKFLYPSKETLKVTYRPAASSAPERRRSTVMKRAAGLFLEQEEEEEEAVRLLLHLPPHSAGHTR